MHLWAFNYPALNGRAILDGIADVSPLTKTLGLSWDRTTNTQLPLYLSPYCTSTATKRNLLRGISYIYGPLGFISPLSIPAHILIEEIWKEIIAVSKARVS